MQLVHYSRNISDPFLILSRPLLILGATVKINYGSQAQLMTNNSITQLIDVKTQGSLHSEN